MWFVVDAKSHSLLNLLSVCLFQGRETAHIQWLKKMGGMSWHIERNNRVLSAEHIKLRPIVAAMSIQNQESISASCTRLGVLIEYLFKPDQS